MQATREVITKLIERAMVPLNVGLGLTSAFLAMIATLFGLMPGE
jgi:hypothetical protein